ADYITVNLSSPNTPGLKSLQHGEQLQNILSPLVERRNQLADNAQKQVPIVVKISPDLTTDEIKHIIDKLLALKIDGVIATNTTISRPAYLKGNAKQEEGGLSGEPVFEPSTQVVKTIYQHVGDALPIIAAGGVSNIAQAKAKLAAGAKLVQIYTGLIYEGPQLVRRIVEKL
ncbi:MAG: dihydroorotate dehydrogenase (quinone), partial [Candidatus Berkiella sp.]